ncbi:hypothetical protein M2347_003097 [Chryseobacterium sp. H1D6B]|uniref:DUF4236 domain-containing protein n=1 Tax=Chryseobacterium sp. H1D6B TaxID=2940588 RepID=UPI0015CD3FB6|nr:DUF4236 domain-containing protein [Chryseobacterium sp. H1D6B]MDH6253370.1 hypothetical protein [Chryseobacterium sp. H1D6B]
MAWSFRKRIKIARGVHLNLSKSGVSTSVKVKRATLNFSKSGTKLTTSTSILGFGISYRYKFGKSKYS